MKSNGQINWSNLLLTAVAMTVIIYVIVTLLVVPSQSPKPVSKEVLMDVNDSKHSIYFDSVKFGVILELKPFGPEFSQDILVARVRLCDDGILERTGYVSKSEGVAVGDRVLVHNFSENNNIGISYTRIITKSGDTNYPNLN